MKMNKQNWLEEKEEDEQLVRTKKRHGNCVRPTQKTRLSGVEGLTIQEVKFADEYSIEPNGKQAAIKAGYSETWAATKASQLLKKKAIRQRIKANLKKARVSTIMQIRERKERLSQIGRADVRDFITIQGNTVQMRIDGKKRKGVLRQLEIDETFDKSGNRKVTHKVQLHDPMKAIAELNRMDGVYDNTVELNGQLVVISKEDEGL